MAARLGTFLDAYTSPRTSSEQDSHLAPATGQSLPRDRVLGEAIPSEVVLWHGGSATTVVITVPRHHHRAPDHRYRTGRLPEAGVGFHRRTWAGR